MHQINILNNNILITGQAKMKLRLFRVQLDSTNFFFGIFVGGSQKRELILAPALAGYRFPLCMTHVA